MHIIINNREAVLKKGVSFDYITENRFFTGADSYTLSITFPLKGCQQNIDIFGHINRKDSNLDKLLMDCEIYDRGFQVSGAVNIVEISEEEVRRSSCRAGRLQTMHRILIIYISMRCRLDRQGIWGILIPFDKLRDRCSYC